MASDRNMKPCPLILWVGVYLISFAVAIPFCTCILFYVLNPDGYFDMCKQCVVRPIPSRKGLAGGDSAWHEEATTSHVDNLQGDNDHRLPT